MMLYTLFLIAVFFMSLVLPTYKNNQAVVIGSLTTTFVVACLTWRMF